MTQRNGGSPPGEGAQIPLAVRLITADPRKFSAYVLDPDNTRGKDRIFLHHLGFRPRSDEDARTLAAAYTEQAREQLGAGRYRLGKHDEHGTRVLTSIELGELRLRSVWVLRPNGVLSLVTPFSGFASDAEVDG